MNRLCTALVILLSGYALAATPTPAKVAEKERIAALKLKGDVTKGEAKYEAACASCHLANGAGKTDGTFPQLAGQHPSVVIKQLADIRAGARENAVMLPFAQQLEGPQELADVAAYLNSLVVPRDNGRGDAESAVLDEGQKLYKRDCVSCHGRSGEGDAKKLYPILAGQHFLYLKRQATEIRDGKRLNANPQMVKVIKKYTDAQIVAVTDFMSRLVMPDAPAPKAKK